MNGFVSEQYRTVACEHALHFFQGEENTLVETKDEKAHADVDGLTDKMAKLTDDAYKVKGEKDEKDEKDEKSGGAVGGRNPDGTQRCLNVHLTFITSIKR